MKDYKWRVTIREYERGWGNRIDEQKLFDRMIDADNFVKEFNSKNNLDEVPDWYMVAEEPVFVEIEV